ncbi:MAG: hypothetical protein AAB618_02595 [Patescibacteria group bacterium]
MNLKAFIFLVAVLTSLIWLFGGGIETLQKDNTKEDVLGNTLDAARGAAKNLSN